jgi:anthranilate phosphoribosyltransferase
VPAPASWSALLEPLLQGHDLDTVSAQELMHGWLEQRLPPELTGAFLAALRCKGVSAGELAAMAAVLRQACPLPGERPDLFLVDTCGTGGDGANSFNISTAVAFTAAACGASVAKHGNRSASGSVGSADVLEILGINLTAPLPEVVGCLPAVGLTFLFAPAWHPALVGLVPLRRSLGVRTVFNLLGPLVNPLRPDAQVLGVARADLLEPMAGALALLGLRRAVVVHGHGGLDEASLSGPNQLLLMEEGRLTSMSLNASDLGLIAAPPSALSGGDGTTNARILEEVLQGGGSDAQRDVVILNTALVLWAAGQVDQIADGIAPARSALAAAAPWARLEALRAALPRAAAG